MQIIIVYLVAGMFGLTNPRPGGSMQPRTASSILRVRAMSLRLCKKKMNMGADVLQSTKPKS